MKHVKIFEQFVNEAKFNVAATPELFGDMIKDIIAKKPGRKYMVIDGFDGEEISARISDKPLKEGNKFGAAVNEAKLPKHVLGFAKRMKGHWLESDDLDDVWEFTSPNDMNVQIMYSMNPDVGNGSGRGEYQVGDFNGGEIYIGNDPYAAEKKIKAIKEGYAITK